MIDLSELICKFVTKIQESAANLTQLIASGDLETAERQVQAATSLFGDQFVGLMATAAFKLPEVKLILSAVAAKMGMHMHHNQTISVRLAQGNEVTINSPWFEKAGSKGKRKNGPKSKDSTRKGAHLGLDFVGVTHKISPVLADQGLRLSLLMPSFALASDYLGSIDRPLSSKLLGALVADSGTLSYADRAIHAWDESESLAGKRIYISIDGGRLRQRITRRGRVPDSQKRRGYDAPWKEPVLFTIYVVDENGRIEGKFHPIVDGVIDGDDRHEDVLKLLSEYLNRIKIKECAAVYLVCDGARWHWTDVVPILVASGVDRAKITEVIDYMHAKQALLELATKCTTNFEYTKDQLKNELVDLLYKGDTVGIQALLLAKAARGEKRAIAKKVAEYFEGNRSRLQYATFRSAGITIGSGAVESAIRRVINLRLKAPGTFWTARQAEAMIFLRSKLLYGRWDQFRAEANRRRKGRFLLARSVISGQAA